MAREKQKTKTCPECGGSMRFEAREDSVEHRGQRRVFKTAAWWCTSCGEAILDAAALKASERALIELRAEVDGVLLPEQVARIREKLELSQREAGRLLGGGPRAFQKYESGQVLVSEPMKNLLLLLGKDPRRLAELRSKPRAGSSAKSGGETGSKRRARRSVDSSG